MSGDYSNKFSVIMASRLIPYANSANHPDLKIVRAIDSVLAQSFKDFELIIIADGCQLTKEIVNQYTDKRIRLLECNHKALFDNTPRNTGIDNAKGEYIIYLDIDDYYGSDHLNIVSNNLLHEWVWYNDIIFDIRSSKWIERACNIRKMGQCGTSNVCHASRLGIKWERPGYGHDYYFNQKLLNHKNHKKIETPEYFVCHIPNVYDR